MVVAICDDKYRANYPRAYLAAHHPLLVLEVNWQAALRLAQGFRGAQLRHGTVHDFASEVSRRRSRFLSHSDEAQIPWGVVRLEFRDEKAVFGAIAPRGPHASWTPQCRPVSTSRSKIASAATTRATKAGRNRESPGLCLRHWLPTSPEFFSDYVRDPKSKNPQAQMPGNPQYDDATMRALTAYFQTFASGGEP